MKKKYSMKKYKKVNIKKKLMINFTNQCCKNAYFSRYKNLYQFGKLGAREIFSQTFRDLDKRIQLECYGKIIQLPSLQGIVIMNIPSYSGGINFWGNTDNHPVSFWRFLFVSDLYNKLNTVECIFQNEIFNQICH